MVRTGIATLMVCVIGATSVSADDAATQNSGTLIEWLTSGNGSQRRSPSVQRAVVSDASRQAPRIRQTSDTPVAPPHPAGALPLVPLPIQSAPVLPNRSAVSGPQYYSVSNAQGIAQPVHPGRNWQQYQAPQPVHRNSSGMYSTISQGVAQGPVTHAQGASASGAPLHPGTALYPSPIPGIPQQMGGTAISNQFLNPHEMLYAHQYRAMYPPYSYKVNGKWMVTPFGVWSHEDWHLQGTVVDVKYKSSISPFALFTPPVRH
jgi:hypothetical protein